jgi:hypothetical protein
MADFTFSKPVEQYVRSPEPNLPESQRRYYQEELRKLEATLTSVREALVSGSISEGAVTPDKLEENITIAFGEGTVSEPSITNNGDTDTGVYFPDANTVGVAAGAKPALRFNEQGLDTAKPAVQIAYSKVPAWEGTGYEGAFPAISTTTKNNRTYGIRFYNDENDSGGVGYGELISGTKYEFREITYGPENSYDAADKAAHYHAFDSTRPDGSGFRRRLAINQDGSFSANYQDYPGISPTTSTLASVGPAYFCRAWVNFNGTGTVAIRASGNVSSITDNDVGNYYINFTIAMPDANYAVVASAGDTDSATDWIDAEYPNSYTTTYVGIYTRGQTSLTDPGTVNVAVFR